MHRILVGLLWACLVHSLAAADPASSLTFRLHDDPAGGFRVRLPDGWRETGMPGTWLELEGARTGPIAPAVSIQLVYRDDGLEAFLAQLLAELPSWGVALSPGTTPRTVAGAGGPFTYLKTVTSGEEPKLVAAWGIYGEGRRFYVVKVKTHETEAELLKALATAVLKSFEVGSRRSPSTSLGKPFVKSGLFGASPPAEWELRDASDATEFEFMRETPRVFIRFTLDTSELDFERHRREPSAESGGDVPRLPVKEVQLACEKGWGLVLSDQPVGQARYQVLDVVAGGPGRHLRIAYHAHRDQYELYWPVVEACLRTVALPGSSPR